MLYNIINFYFPLFSPLTVSHTGYRDLWLVSLQLSVFAFLGEIYVKQEINIKFKVKFMSGLFS